jgi:hypothetical protein
MSDLRYCQYAFAQPECRVQEIGPGIDPRFVVELMHEGQVAAVVSRVGLDQFVPERLQGKTAEDIQWLGTIAARHNEIICRAAASSAVLPLRLGTLFHSRDSLLASLRRLRSTVAEFLTRLGCRQEWGVKLYLAKDRPAPIPGHVGPPRPHYLSRPNPSLAEDSPVVGATRTAGAILATSGTAYLARKRAQLDRRREERQRIHRTIQDVERRLADKAEQSCRIRNLPSSLTGRAEEMVFNAAFLLPSSMQTNWLETVQDVFRDVQNEDLLLEVSGPWPPYHFCPALES